MLGTKEALLVLAALEAWETESFGVAEEIGIICRHVTYDKSNDLK